MDSILDSVKKLLGVSVSDDSYDVDIITHINMAFMVLNQLGVGPLEGFKISDRSSQWTDFLTSLDVESIKSYVYLKVRLLFDPPSNSSVIESINRTISELEWRFNVKYDMEAS